MKYTIRYHIIKSFSTAFLVVLLGSSTGIYAQESFESDLPNSANEKLFLFDQTSSSESVISGQYIVVLDSVIVNQYTETLLSTRRDAIITISSILTAFSNGDVDMVYERAFNGFRVSGISRTRAASIAQDHRVKLVEADRRNQFYSSRLSEPEPTPTQFNPDWGLDRIDQRLLPLDETYAMTGFGSGVNVYIIDTGIDDTHPDFEGRVLQGVTFIGDGNGTFDCNGHGTHVAGIVGSETYGVAKDVGLIPVRTGTCSAGTSVSLLNAGIDWVADNAILPAVANMSFGVSPPSPSMELAVENLVNAGVVGVAAAGNNNGQDACSLSPANVPEVITVAATNSSDQRASFSNIGSCVDVFAPGASILSTHTTIFGTSIVRSGTSMAAPFVSGRSAIRLERASSDSPSEVSDYITGWATEGIISSVGFGSPNLMLYSPNRRDYLQCRGQCPP